MGCPYGVRSSYGVVGLRCRVLWGGGSLWGEGLLWGGGAHGVGGFFGVGRSYGCCCNGVGVPWVLCLWGNDPQLSLWGSDPQLSLWGGSPPASQRRKASVLSAVRAPSERETMGSVPWKLLAVAAYSSPPAAMGARRQRGARGQRGSGVSGGQRGQRGQRRKRGERGQWGREGVGSVGPRGAEGSKGAEGSEGQWGQRREEGSEGSGGHKGQRGQTVQWGRDTKFPLGSPGPTCGVSPSSTFGVASEGLRVHFWGLHSPVTPSVFGVVPPRPTFGVPPQASLFGVPPHFLLTIQQRSVGMLGVKGALPLSIALPHCDPRQGGVVQELWGGGGQRDPQMWGGGGGSMGLSGGPTDVGQEGGFPGIPPSCGAVAAGRRHTEPPPHRCGARIAQPPTLSPTSRAAHPSPHTPRDTQPPPGVPPPPSRLTMWVQAGLKALVPHAYRWVRFRATRTRMKLKHSV